MEILHCQRCDKDWCFRGGPVVRCGNCKSPYWDRKPKNQKSALDTIREVSGAMAKMYVENPRHKVKITNVKAKKVWK